jgi:predicted class III extradiol MEMO1 family dioxygenase
MKNFITKYYNKASMLVLTSSLFVYDVANAATKDNAAAMKKLVETSDSIFAGDLLQVALTIGGVGAMTWSMISGFRAAPLIGGFGIIAFNLLYSTYLKSYFG